MPPVPCISIACANPDRGSAVLSLELDIDVIDPCRGAGDNT